MNRYSWLIFVLIVTGLFMTVLYPPLIIASDGDTQWSWPDGDPVVEANKNQRFYDVISDGNGGAIIVWQDEIDFDPLTNHIKAQRLDYNGDQQWSAPTGKWVTNNFKSESPAITTNCLNGCIAAYQSYDTAGGGYKIFAQNLDANGNRQWGSNGVAVSSTFYGSYNPVICSDGNGGAFIGFGPRLVYVNSSGVVTAPGIDGIEIIPGGTGTYKLINDGSGGWFFDGTNWIYLTHGVFAVWVNSSTGEILAQRVQGGLQWGTGGTHVGTHDAIGGFDLARDGSGGLLICWGGSDGWWPIRAQVRAQRFNSSGSILWSYNGETIIDSNTVGGTWSSGGPTPVVASDETGGAIISWTDSRHLPAGDIDIYAQRLDANGSSQWTVNGVLLPPYIVGQTAPGAQADPHIIGDGLGGAIITYADLGAWSWDVSATRLNPNGNKLWSQWIRWDGTSHSDPGNSQSWPAIVFDYSGPEPKGVVITWVDHVGGSALDDIFAQKVEISQTPPANNNCADAPILNAGTDPAIITHFGTLYMADNDGSAGCGSSSDQPDVWYKYTAASDGLLTVSTCGTNDMWGEDQGIDTVLSLHSACPGTPTNQLACNDDWPDWADPGVCSGTDAGATRDSAATLIMMDGDTVLIRVSRYPSSYNGKFRLNLKFKPGNICFGDFDLDQDVDGTDLAVFASGTGAGLDSFALHFGRTDCP